MNLQKTDAKVTAANSPQPKGQAEKMVQIFKSSITQLAIHKDAKCEEPLPVLINAIRAKKSKDGYSIYTKMFSSSPERLSSPSLKRIEVALSENHELYQDLDQESRITQVLTIESRPTERFPQDLQNSMNPYETDNLILAKRPSRINKLVLAPKWMGPS